MKFKLTVLLATFVVTMGLLLGTSTAQAATVILGDDDNVIGIENLPVFNEITEETILYNVDFVYDTALNVYATGEFDFPDRTMAILATLAVRDALNANEPIPLAAGPRSTSDFFIGNDVDRGIVVAAGSEIIEGVVPIDAAGRLIGPLMFAALVANQDVMTVDLESIIDDWLSTVRP